MPEITEEELKNMTPEQIAELQKQNCIFCHIISGRVPSKKIYEDDKALAILDIHPARPGHVLVLPKQHYAILPQVPEDIIGHLFMVAKHLSQAMLRAFKVQGTNIVVQNGAAADQKAPHFMVHVIPREEGDKLGLQLPKSKMAEPQMVQVHQRLLQGVKKTFGVDQPIKEPQSSQSPSGSPERDITEKDKSQLERGKPEQVRTDKPLIEEESSEEGSSEQEALEAGTPNPKNKALDQL